jgi:hypothetical protein
MTPLMRLEQLSKNCHDAIATLKSEATSTRGVWKRRLLLEQLKLLTTYSDELDAALSAMKEDRSIGATAVDATKASEFPMTPPLTTERKKKRPRYQLHWASGQSPNPALKWAIYDWDLICPVAYMQSRVTGRKVCALLNTEAQR